METKTGGHLFIKVVQQTGTTFIFGTTGAGMPDIQDAMVVEKPPKWIQGLHEFPTLNAAAGYALVSEQTGVALVDRMVGTQNAMGALYAAYLNSAPIVVFATSNIPGAPILTGEMEYHYHSHQTVLGSVWAKWSTEASSLETLEDDIYKAFELAQSEHLGPTYVTLRQDLMAQRTNISPRILSHGREDRHISVRIPSDETLLKIIKEIFGHDTPQILVSHLGRHKSAVRSLVDFANTFALPVKDRRVFMNYPMTDPFFTGFQGSITPPDLARGTNLAICLEIGFLPPQRFLDDVYTIDLVSDPLHRQDVIAGGDYGSSFLPVEIRAICDVGPTLNKLVKMAQKSELLKHEKKTLDERTAESKELHENILKDWRKTSKKAFESGVLNNWSVGYVLNKYWTDNMIWISGLESEREGFAKSIELDRPGTFFSNPSAHLGAAVGMAYGAAMADRNYVEVQEKDRFLKIGRITDSSRVVICTVGDGDAVFGNIDSALWTCSHYGIGVLYIVANNACWGVEWPYFGRTIEKWAENTRDFEFVDLDRPRIQFAKIAQGFNVQSEEVQSLDQFESSLINSIKTVQMGKPALIDVHLEKHTGRIPSSVP